MHIFFLRSLIYARCKYRVGGKVNWGKEEKGEEKTNYVWFVGNLKREPHIFMFSLITFVMGNKRDVIKARFRVDDYCAVF